MAGAERTVLFYHFLLSTVLGQKTHNNYTFLFGFSRGSYQMSIYM